MDVGEYIRRKQREQEKNENQASQQNESVQSALGRYQSMSEEQLMQELFRVGKVSSGNVSAKELDAFYDSVKGFLTPEQSAKMRALILQLKNE